MKTTFVLSVGLLAAAICGAEPTPLRFDAIMPAAAELGGSWTSNGVVVLVDSASAPKEICNEGEGWLKAAQNALSKPGCTAYGVTRYYWEGRGHFLVWSKRFESKEQIGNDWGKNYDGLGNEIPPKDPIPKLPKVGDEVRFYQRHTMHNNIAFRRDAFVFDVEGQAIEQVKELAVAIDRKMLRAMATNLPEKFAPFQVLLGEWTGNVELKITSPEGPKRIQQQRTSLCKYDSALDAVVMVDTEPDPWTKQLVTTTGVIRWDEQSQLFKAKVSGTDGSVQSFTIQDARGKLLFRQVDAPRGTKFHSEVTREKNGQVIETGSRHWPAPHDTTADWKVTYSRTATNAQPTATSHNQK